jgi:hypothetical protein
MKKAIFGFLVICLSLSLANCDEFMGAISKMHLKLDKTTATMSPGSVLILTATVDYQGIISEPSIKWSSSNTSRATVVSTGRYTALVNIPMNATAGTVTITASTDDGISTATCTVTVSVNPTTIAVVDILINKTNTSLVVGQTEQLVATISPFNATNKAVNWTTNNDAVATVNTNGVITAKAVGSATITVRTQDGNKTAFCTVTVSPAASEYVIINGVKWATCNVDERGFFASSPENFGKFYQWDSMIPWPTSGEEIGWLSQEVVHIESWPSRYDPCPSGYRVPTFAEFKALSNPDKVIFESIKLNGIIGMKFTDKDRPLNSIFLPCAGYRNQIGKLMMPTEDWGQYWSSSTLRVGSDLCPVLILLTIPPSGVYATWASYGSSIRCVTE